MTDKQGRLAPMCTSACRGAADCVIALKSTQGLLGFFFYTDVDAPLLFNFLLAGGFIFKREKKKSLVMTSFGGGFFQKRLVNERAKGGNSFAAEERIPSNDIKSSPFFL